MIRFLQRSDRLADLNSVLFSTVCHFAVLVGLGLLAASNPNEWGGITLRVHADQGDSPRIDQLSMDEPAELKLVVEPLPAAAAWDSVDLGASATPFAAFESLPHNLASSGALDGLALNAGSQPAAASGIAATEFFGIGGYGQSFVYVVDCSDSMNEQGKFDRARYELLRSVEQLASDQRYFIIFFNDGPHPMNAKELLPATQDQFARTADWVGHIEAVGGTNPLPALLIALSLRPDAIYFLSDGQFDPLTIPRLRVQNRPKHRARQRIPIHSIAFVDRMTVSLMRAISRDSGGEFRFVR